MAKFKIKLQASAIVETEVEVEAASASEAESLAIRQADFDPFKEHEWKVTDIEGCIDSISVVEVK